MADELELVGPFLRDDRVTQLESELRLPLGRRRFRAELGRFNGFDPRWQHPVPVTCQHPAGLALLLRLAGSPERVLVLSENPAWDGKRMPLPEILTLALWSGMGTLVVCEPGRLAYYEAEDPGDRRLLVRREL